MLAVRENSEQRNAHHGKAWHQVRAPGWATRRVDRRHGRRKENMRNLRNLTEKCEENNKRAFYLK
nr:MAG TPA: hypothetical protein [Caudoviricetes sp.]